MIQGYEQFTPGLEQSIIEKIHRLQKRRLFWRQSVYGLVSLASFAGVIMSVLSVIKTLSSSGVYQYISLLFSDVSTLSYWKEISLSVAESLPFLGLALVLGVAGLCLWSAVKTMKIQHIKSALA